MANSGDWRIDADYEYCDDLTPEQIAFEFLRRNPDYDADFREQSDAPSTGTADESAAQARRWGLRFAVDPRLRSDEAEIIWLPSQNPRLVVLTTAPPGMFGGPTLRGGRPSMKRVASEGSYVDLRALAQPQGALITHPELLDAPVAIMLPLDALFEERVDTARQVWRALTGRHQVSRRPFTAQRRRRLKLMLRAVDASLLGIGYRDIAQGLFGDRVPGDASWRTHSLRATTIRLVREGRSLMSGGYLRLLRSERRSR